MIKILSKIWRELENDHESIEKEDNSVSVNEALACLKKLRTFAESSGFDEASCMALRNI